jgi:hypothetical protein
MLAARHVIQRMVHPRLLNKMPLYDVASNICRAVLNGHFAQMARNLSGITVLPSGYGLATS